MSTCPVCGEPASQANINLHLDNGCPKKNLKREWSFMMPGKVAKESESARPKIDETQTPTKPSLKTSPSSQGKSSGGAIASNANTGKVFTDSRGSPTSTGSNTTSTTSTSNTASHVAANSNITSSNNNNSSISNTNTTKPNPTASARRAAAPLAEQMRPKTFESYVGQSHITSLLQQLLPNLPSMILWGPSGSGKTTLARVLATQLNARFVELSAPSAGANDVKKIIADAKREFQLLQRRTILFLDEIHRFNRSQQDSLLQGVERGDIILIGATTENPSFKIAGALLSRVRVFILGELNHEELTEVVKRAVEDGEEDEELSPKLVDTIVNASGGDARRALNMLETVRSLPKGADPSLILKHTLVHDQRGESHYDLISAFHKSVRGGDADAALYYLSRMLCGGEDPQYLSRRMMRIASEDVGLADDSCLPFCVATHTAVQQVGMPECDVMLAHAAVKLARAPKSVDVYKAYGMLKAEMAAAPQPPVPMHLRNAPTKLMEDVGYSKGYKYNPSFIGEVKQEYLPEEMKGQKWLGVYRPTERDYD